MPASHLADQVFLGIETGKFYILVDNNCAPFLDETASFHAEEIYKERLKFLDRRLRFETR